MVGESLRTSLEWTVCKRCGMKTIMAKFCMRCGAVLDLTQSQEPIQYVYTFNVIVLGEDGVGKTSLINKWAAFFQPSTLLAPVEAVNKITLDGIEVNLKIREMEHTLAKVPDNIDAAVVVFEVTRRTTFLKTMRFLRLLKEIKAMPIVCLVGNKCDSEDRQVSFEEAANTAKDMGVQYFETSAVSGHKVDVVLKMLLRELLTRRLRELKGLLQK